jgi:hypothetical protein
VGFLPKPFVLTALLESVRVLMARNGHAGLLHGHRASASPELFFG